jgi:ABC-2 type transport system ATP-binding protein
MSISVKNITKLYDTQKALDNISFEIQSGEIVGFLGPNGAGKSTMMKILTCYIPQTEGEAKVCGYNVAEQAEEVKRIVGYLPESNPLYYDMYVKEYLEFVANLYKVSGIQAKVKEMIDLTGLTPEKGKKIGALSKGYKQRVGLAQALIHDPKVLILDEPTSGLDPNQLIDIRNLIRESGREKTVMMSTHIMQEVEAICNRVIIINQGKIVADNKISELKNISSQQQVFTVELEQEIDKAFFYNELRVSRCEKAVGNMWILEADYDVRSKLFKSAVDKGYSILTIQKEEHTLEDVFRSVTNK